MTTPTIGRQRCVGQRLSSTLLPALLPLTLLGTSGAFAADSVTVFGVLDAGLRYIDNEGFAKTKVMTTGAQSSSRFGLRGNEDLGGGLWAGFWIESSLFVDTGAAGAAGGQFWDRRSTVSLGHRGWGEVRLGRDYTPTFMAYGEHDPFTSVGVGTGNVFTGPPSPTVRDAFGANARTDIRANNTIQLILQGESLGGFTGLVMLSPSEGGPAAGNGRVRAFRVGYRLGDWSAHLAQTKTLISAALGELDERVAAVSYDTKPVKISWARREFHFRNSHQVNDMLAATVPLGVHTIKGSYVRGDGRGTASTGSIDANDSRQIALGYGYNLSKRTSLFANVSQIWNDGRAQFAVREGPSVIPGGRSRGYEAGVTHRF